MTKKKLEEGFESKLSREFLEDLIWEKDKKSLYNNIDSYHHLAKSVSTIYLTASAKAANKIDLTDFFEKYDLKIKDNFAIAQHAKLGVNCEVFAYLVAITTLTPTFLAEKLFGISYKTIKRYAAEDRPFSMHEAEISLKLVRLYKKGSEIFGNNVNFSNWLQKPAFGLGNQIPLELLGLNTGIDLVMDELMRIEFGALA
jgi:putative toxin-antitoxin system antitoxin component (TIGR02293 family)